MELYQAMIRLFHGLQADRKTIQTIAPALPEMVRQLTNVPSVQPGCHSNIEKEQIQL